MMEEVSSESRRHRSALMPKKLGVACKPQPWLLQAIRNHEFDAWHEKGKYFILNTARAKDRWVMSSDVFENSLGDDASNKHYYTFGTDGEVCIKSYFNKRMIDNLETPGFSQTSSTDDSSQSCFVDWRDCSMWLVKYCLKVMLPSNSNKPECILLIDDCALLHESSLDLEDYGAGFMNCCTDFSEVENLLAEYWELTNNNKGGADAEVRSTTTQSRGDANLLKVSVEDCTDSALSALITLMSGSNESQEVSQQTRASPDCDVVSCSNGSDVFHVDISEESEETSAPTAKSKTRRCLNMAPGAVTVSALWKTADRDMPPGWRPSVVEDEPDFVATSTPKDPETDVHPVEDSPFEIISCRTVGTQYNAEYSKRKKGAKNLKIAKKSRQLVVIDDEANKAESDHVISVNGKTVSNEHSTPPAVQPCIDISEYDSDESPESESRYKNPTDFYSTYRLPYELKRKCLDIIGLKK